MVGFDLKLSRASQVEWAAPDGVDIRRLVYALRRAKLIILAVMCAGALFSYFLVSRMDPVYTARASVMLEPRKTQVLSAYDVVSDANLNNPLLDTEAAVLRSNLLLKEVVASFDQSELTNFDPANEPPSLMSRIKDYVASGLRLVTGGGKPLVNPVSNMSDEERRSRRLLNQLRESLTVRRDGQSYLLLVAVETGSAQLSADLANRVVQKYIERQLDYLSDRVGSAHSFLTQQVEELRRYVEVAEDNVEDFRVNRLALGGVSVDAINQQLLDISTQVAVSRAEQASAEARYRQIQSMIEDLGYEVAGDLIASPFVQGLRERKFELEQQDADLAVQYGPEHRTRQSLRASIDAVNAEILTEVKTLVAQLRSEASVAQIRQSSLEESMAELEKLSAEMSRGTLELRQLEREAEAARGSFQTALERLNEVRSASELPRADARIVEEALVPGGPSGPRVMLFSLLGAVICFSSAVIVVCMRAMRETVFTSSHKLDEATGIRAAITLPRENWNSVQSMVLSLLRQPYQPYVERLRQLRLRLISGADQTQQARSILFASSVANEGKTSAAVSFAYLEAINKRKCILVDLDVRRSHLTKDIGYAPQNGDLLDYMEGKVPLEGAISHVEKLGFDLLSTSKAYPGFLDKVSPTWMQALLSELYKEYDVVVFDTAPVLLAPDALPLLKWVDAVVLLVRYNSTHRSAVSETVHRLTEMGTRKLELTLSMADRQDEVESYGLTGYDDY